MFDLNHPFFKPLWIRIATSVAPIAWGGFEFWSGSPGWGMMFVAVGGYAAYRFFFNFEPRDK